MPTRESTREPIGDGMDHAAEGPYTLNAGVWAVLALLVGLLVTAEIARREWVSQHWHAAELQHSLADAAQTRLRAPFDGAAVALRSMQTVFLADDVVTQADFDQYQRNLLMAQMVEGYVLTAFARRYEDPAMPGHPVYRYDFVSPLAGNEVLVGFDIARQPENLKALLRSRDSGMATASMPFTLLQFQGSPGAEGRGITVRMPVYTRGPLPATAEERRDRELGALAVSMRTEPLVREALKGRILEYLDVVIRDLDALPGQEVVYATGEPPADASKVHVRHLDFGGRRWEVRLWPKIEIAQWGQFQLILLAGTTTSMLVALFLWSQITSRRRAVALGRDMRQRFGESENRFRVLNDVLPALVLLAEGRGGRITYINQAARRQLGEVVGAPLASLFNDPGVGASAIAEASENGSWKGADALMLDGQDGPGFWATASLAHVEVDAEPHLLMVATDVSAQRAMTEQLRYQAAHDELTGLYNRREFERRLRGQLALRSEDPAAPPFALLYIDLDQFKLINDLSGHMAGDQLLVQLVHTMRRELRAGDVLARLGGDEFGLLALDVDPQLAHHLAERMRVCIEAATFLWQGRTYTTSASIGLVLVDHEGCTLKDLLAWADSACYQAKENGRNRVCWYQEDDDTTRRISEMEWTNRLRWALERDALLLDYQEVTGLDPDEARSTHIELLLRMRDEQGEVVAPGAFLQAAERYGLMPAIDRWVIRTALANFKRLHPVGATIDTVAINLSGASIEDEGLADFILDAITQYGVEPHRLVMEITETVAVRDLARVVRVIERLRAVGCRIALDDFGAGMSSFGYLKNLPVDVIKIDGSFVRDLGNDPMSYTIIDAVTRIGHQRGLKVVAEWVDSQQTVDVLRGLGVDYAQGFALHRPERVLFQRDR